MNTNFGIIWLMTIGNLKPGMKIDYWGKARGKSGKKFVINSVSEKFISCDPPEAKHIQKVHRDDFEAVWELWENYLAGKVQRKNLIKVTRFSSYILSIFNHVFLD